MEKKKYEELELEVVRFDAEDMIATSGGSDIPTPVPFPPCTADGCLMVCHGFTPV